MTSLLPQYYSSKFSFQKTHIILEPKPLRSIHYYFFLLFLILIPLIGGFRCLQYCYFWTAFIIDLTTFIQSSLLILSILFQPLLLIFIYGWAAFIAVFLVFECQALIAGHFFLTFSAQLALIAYYFSAWISLNCWSFFIAALIADCWVLCLNCWPLFWFQP